MPNEAKKFHAVEILVDVCTLHAVMVSCDINCLIAWLDQVQLKVHARMI